MKHKHYVFHNNIAHGPLCWEDVKAFPVGTCAYTPTDDSPTNWFELTKSDAYWNCLKPEDVPAAFKGQLLLLGVPL